MALSSQAFVNPQFLTTNNQTLIREFRRARFWGLVAKVWATITGRPHTLLDVQAITQGKSVCGSRYAGSQTIDMRQIKGSEGRSQDFDRNFNPLKTHTQARWVSIASAWRRGVYLPAVELIKIGDAYMIRDGHHRISVARFMGCNFVDAQVTEWRLAD